MLVFFSVISLVFGFLLGRAYGWMKYRYPESQEMIKLKVAKLREERAFHETRTERYRSEIDGEIERRMRG